MPELLEAARIPFVAIDLDNLSWCYPSPPDDDRFRNALIFKDLAAVWLNFSEKRRCVLSRPYSPDRRHHMPTSIAFRSPGSIAKCKPRSTRRSSFGLYRPRVVSENPAKGVDRRLPK